MKRKLGLGPMMLDGCGVLYFGIHSTSCCCLSSWSEDLNKDSKETAINIDLNDQVKEIGSGALTAARRDFGVICGGNKVDGGEMAGNRERKFDEYNRF